MTFGSGFGLAFVLVGPRAGLLIQILKRSCSTHFGFSFGILGVRFGLLRFSSWVSGFSSTSVISAREMLMP